MRLKIFVYLILISGVGCKKALDITPENSLTFKNALQSQKDLEAALGAAGQYVLRMSNWNFSLQPSKGEYADELQYYTPERELSPEYIPYDNWDHIYKIIAQSNIVLHFIKEVEMPQNRNDYYRGQAYFYKALAYFELIRKFGDVVVIGEEVNIEPMAKTPWPLVADHAIDLAEKAAALLPDWADIKDYQGQAPKYKSNPSKGAANALLAHLCAWKAGGKYFAGNHQYNEMELWRKAEAACSAVIASPSYSLATTPEQVCTEVLVGNSRESIYETVYKDLWHELNSFDWQASFTLGDLYESWPVIPNTGPSDIQNAPFRIYNTTVLNMFPGSDLRKNSWFYEFETMSDPSMDATTGGLAYPYKFREIKVSTEGWTAGQFMNFNVNRIWWRLADIYLLRAECRSRLNKNEEAITDINAIRTRANADLYAPSEYNGDLRYAVFKEREKELLMEGHRYYDIIRNGYARQELQGGFLTASDQDFIDGAFFILIHQQEFARNPLMRQNKYWLKFL
jgi:hypothetical protein